MFFSDSERRRRKEEIDRERGITPKMKRYNEIKAGVITCSIGLAAMIFLYFLMQGIILSDENPSNAAILSRIWLAGVFPFFVGIALIINGWFVSKGKIEAIRQAQQQKQEILSDEETPALSSGQSDEFITAGFGVTEGTTKLLNDLGQKR
jgi:hypothetical protein